MSLTSQQYADLAEQSYDRNGNMRELVDKTFALDGVSYKLLEYADNPRNGYQGMIFQRVDSGEIVVAHRGSEFDRELLKDGVVADGGMMLARVNAQAGDAIDLTQRARGYAQDSARFYDSHAPEVTVTGHSLGGTLAQITAHHFGLKGETFNAYGAASLGYRIPKGGNAVLNHVMATDPVSAASPHYGQVRVYAARLEVAELAVFGYANNRNPVDPRDPAAAMQGVTNWHYMHRFLNADGDGKPDRSILADPQARELAAEFGPMIDKYRNDVGALRAGVTMAAAAVSLARAGPMGMPARTAELARAVLQPDLEPGEPARLEAGARARQSSAGAVAGSYDGAVQRTRDAAASTPLPGVGAPLENRPSALAQNSDPYRNMLRGVQQRFQSPDDDITTLETVTVTAPKQALGRQGGGKKSQQDESEQQDAPTPDKQAQTFPSDHHDYALFLAIQQQLPKGTPDDKTAEVMHQAKLGGVLRAGQLERVSVNDDRAVVLGKTWGSHTGRIALSSQAPAIETTLQQTQSFDQRRAEELTKFHAEQAEIAKNPTGPVMKMSMSGPATPPSAPTFESRDGGGGGGGGE